MDLIRIIFISESLDPEFLYPLFLVLPPRLFPGFPYILLLIITTKSGSSPLKYLRIICFSAARYLRRTSLFNFLYLKSSSESFLEFSNFVYFSFASFSVILPMNFLCVFNVSSLSIKGVDCGVSRITYRAWAFVERDRLWLNDIVSHR